MEGRDLEKHRRNEYQKETDDLMRLAGHQALAIDTLKKSTTGKNKHVYCMPQTSDAILGNSKRTHTHRLPTYHSRIGKLERKVSEFLLRLKTK